MHANLSRPDTALDGKITDEFYVESVPTLPQDSIGKQPQGYSYEEGMSVPA